MNKEQLKEATECYQALANVEVVIKDITNFGTAKDRKQKLFYAQNVVLKGFDYLKDEDLEEILRVVGVRVEKAYYEESTRFEKL